MIFAIFHNFDRYFWTLGVGIAEIGLQIMTRRPSVRLYGNFGKFIYVIILRNSQLAYFLVTL